MPQWDTEYTITLRDVAGWDVIDTFSVFDGALPPIPAHGDFLRLPRGAAGIRLTAAETEVYYDALESGEPADDLRVYEVESVGFDYAMVPHPGGSGFMHRHEVTVYLRDAA